MSLEEGLAILHSRLAPVCEEEEVPLEEAAGRVLARSVAALVAMPPWPNSAMDGYGLTAADAAEGTPLPLCRRIAAGQAPGDPVPRGQAVRIFTGAPLPEGLDTVVMQEETEEVDQGRAVRFLAPIKRGSNIRLKGEDFSEGQDIVQAGCRLRPPDLAIAASAGHPRLWVRRRLRVAVFSTGDELTLPGQPLPPGGIYDSNRFAVLAMLRAMGCDASDLGIVRDDPSETRAALKAAAKTHDLVITSGGVSMGGEDHVRGAVEDLGSLHFWRLALKPGRPAALGRLGEKTAFLGLPGNPVASQVSFLLLARPLIHRLQGRTATPLPSYVLPAGFRFAKKPGRREFIRAWTEEGADGRQVVRRFPGQDSHLQTSMVRATGLVDIPQDSSGVEDGENVRFLPFPFAEGWL